MFALEMMETLYHTKHKQQLHYGVLPSGQFLDVQIVQKYLLQYAKKTLLRPKKTQLLNQLLQNYPILDPLVIPNRKN